MGSGSERRQHLVEVYEDAHALADRVVPFLEKALADNGAAAAVARPSHLAAFERRLAEYGHDVETLIASKRLALVDAQTLLDSFMDGRLADRERFRACIGRERDSASTIARSRCCRCSRAASLA